MNSLLLLNGLKSVDIGFFIGCGVVIALIIAVYYLIPVFNKKQYEEQRENLRKREAAFKANKGESYVENEIEASEGQVDNEPLEYSVISDNEAANIVSQFENMTDSDIIDAVDVSNEDIEG